jgi:co-chaperonin GroES (HSP10)
MIKPLNKYIVCKRKEKEAKGALIMLNEELSNEFVVVALASDVDEVSVDDTILLDRYQGREVEIEGEKLVFVNIQHIIAKYE